MDINDVFGLADKYSQQYGMDPLVLKSLIMQESGGDPNAVGDGGRSRGLLQLYDKGRGAGVSNEDAFNPEKNISLSMPEISAAYKRATDEGYSGSALAVRVAELAQRPKREHLLKYGTWYEHLKTGVEPKYMLGTAGFETSNQSHREEVVPKATGLFEGVTPFGEIAKQLDPLLPQNDYDRIREKYFFDNIAPRLVKAHVSVPAEYEQFKKATERPSILNFADKVKVQGALVGTGFTKEMIAPMTFMNKDIKAAYEDLTQKEQVLQAVLDREGVSGGQIAEGVGALLGSAAPLALTGMAGSAITSASLGLKAASFGARVMRGGISFGLWEALREQDDDQRAIAGLRGAATGVAFDVGLGLLGRLKKGYAGRVPKAEVEKTAKDLMAGKTPETPLDHAVDDALSKEIAHGAETAREHGIPARVTYTGISDQAELTLRLKKRGQIIGQKTLDLHDLDAAHKELVKALDEGWEVEGFDVYEQLGHRIDELNKRLNERLELRYNDTITRVGQGQDAEKIAEKLGKQDNVTAKVGQDGRIILQGSLSKQWTVNPSDSAVTTIGRAWEAATGKKLDEVFPRPEYRTGKEGLSVLVKTAWQFEDQTGPGALLGDALTKARNEAIAKVREIGLPTLVPTDTILQMKLGAQKLGVIPRAPTREPWADLPLRKAGVQLPEGLKNITAQGIHDELGANLVRGLAENNFASIARYPSTVQGRNISLDYIADLTNKLWRGGKWDYVQISKQRAWDTVKEFFPEVLPTKENFPRLDEQIIKYLTPGEVKAAAKAAASEEEDRLADELEKFVQKEIEEKEKQILQGKSPSSTGAGFGTAEGERLTVTGGTQQAVSGSGTALFDQIKVYAQEGGVTAADIAGKFGVTNEEALDMLDILAKETEREWAAAEGPMRSVEAEVLRGRMINLLARAEDLRGGHTQQAIERRLGHSVKELQEAGIVEPGKAGFWQYTPEIQSGEFTMKDFDRRQQAARRMGGSEAVPPGETKYLFLDKEGKVVSAEQSRMVEVEANIKERGPYFRGTATEPLPGGMAGASIQNPGGKPTILSQEWDKSTLWHESTHALTDNAEIPWRDMFWSESSRRAAYSIAKRLQTKHYPEMSPSGLLSEAFTYVATAVRMGDLDAVYRYGRIDNGVDNVLKMVREASLQIKMQSLGKIDHLGNRLLQSRMDDLMRRTSTDVMQALSTTQMYNRGSIWFDAAKKEWVADAFADEGTVRFKKLDDLWDFVTERDPNITAPSYSMALEVKGFRGPIVPEGATPQNKYPMPEVPVDARWKVGGLAITGWFRPFLNWAETVDKRINKVYATMNKNVPFYEKIRNVDLMYRTGMQWLQKHQTELTPLLEKLPGAKQKDIFEWMSYKVEERPSAAVALKLTPEQVKIGEKLEDWLKRYSAETGIWASNWVKNTYPKLRGNKFIPETVWAQRYDPKSADAFETWVREGELEAKDTHFGRFSQFLLRKGMEKKFTDTPLRELQKMVQTQTQDGRYILGPLRGPVESYIRYMRGFPDVSQQAMNWGMQSALNFVKGRLEGVNKFLPERMRFNTEFNAPQQVINKFLVFSYAMGLGGRIGANLRDMAQVFITSMPVLGPTKFFAAMGKVLSDGGKSWQEATDAGALLFRKNIGEMYGDVISEIPVQKGLSDKLVKLSTKMLQPQRWTDNFGRLISFVAERDSAREWIAKYRAGTATADELVNNTGLWWLDTPNRTRLLGLAGQRWQPPTELVKVTGIVGKAGREAGLNTGEQVGRAITRGTPGLELVRKELPLPTKPGVPVAASEADYINKLADQFGLEYLDTVHWPYRRGGQPALLHTGAGRVFGQYGMWPMNYLDFMRRGATKLAENPRKAGPALGLWLATNYGFAKGFETMGADSAQWFFQSPAGYAGGPHLQLVGDMMRSLQEDDEGRAARARVLQYPVSFMPAGAEIRSVLKGMYGDEGSDGLLSAKMIRILGMRPYTAEEDKSFTEWLLYETGFKGARRRP